VRVTIASPLITSVSTKFAFVIHQSSSAAQSVDDIRATFDRWRLEQWRPYGEERQREHVHHG
jgi:hypothetical protein